MKLIVLTSDRFGTASNCLPTVHASRECSISRVVISRGLSPNRALLWQRKLKKVRKIGILGALNGIRMRSWYQGDTPDLVLLCERLGIPIFETDCTNSEETVRLFKESSPDLGLSLGNGYISHTVFSVPKYGMINVHGELLPEYQNAQSVIWPIYHLEMTTGLTIHQIERSIDTGKILYRDEYPIVFCNKLEHTVRKTIEVTRQRIPTAVRYVCENYETMLKDARTQENGRKFTTPTIRQFYRMVRNNTVLYQQSRRSNSR
jgi:methionyl-tRNA formyltransferase